MEGGGERIGDEFLFRRVADNRFRHRRLRHVPAGAADQPPETKCAQASDLEGVSLLSFRDSGQECCLLVSASAIPEGWPPSRKTQLTDIFMILEKVRPPTALILKINVSLTKRIEDCLLQSMVTDVEIFPLMYRLNRKTKRPSKIY